MQALRATHVAQRPDSTVVMEYEPTGLVYHPSLPKGAQPPQIQPRNDLPLNTQKRKNVLRKTSKSSSSTTVASMASTTSNSDHHDISSYSFTPFRIHSDYQSMPTDPGNDPLLDRLRYDLSFPPQQKPLPPPPIVETEAQFNRLETDNAPLQGSWSDSGHLTRQNTFSALFISPSSSSSSSETGHYDTAYRSRTHPHPHAHQHAHPPPMPLSYHLPSRRLPTGYPRSPAHLNDLDSSISHSTEPNLPRKVSPSWWKRPLGILSDKGKHKEECQHPLSRATSLSLSTEPRPHARRFRNENGVLALSSSTSESGHVFVIPSEHMDTSPSRAQRKLKKRPPSAWNPIKATQTTIPSPYVQQPAPVPVNAKVPYASRRQQQIPNQRLPLPALSIPSIPVNTQQPPQDIVQYRHTVYDFGRQGQVYDDVAIARRSYHVPPTSQNFQYPRPHPTSEINEHSPLSAEFFHYIPAPRNNNSIVSPARRVSETLSSDMSPPLQAPPPLRMHIPFNPTPVPNPTFSASARCKSAPDLTLKSSNRPSRGLPNIMVSSPYSTSNGTKPESAAALVQSPVSDSSTPDSPLEEQIPSPPTLAPPVSAMTRPSFLRTPSNRRWTLAVSETPEDELVEELERLRKIGWGLGFQGELVKVKEGEGVDIDTEPMTDTNGNITNRRQEASHSNLGNVSSNVKWRKEEMEQWLIARKALLVCREIVRTEKTYREGLETLERGETLNDPPPLLLQYLPALISASHAFSTRLAEDPSAWGVSTAFIGCEEVLEAAFVAWSGVVGEFFGKSTDDHGGKRDTMRLPRTLKGRTGRRIGIGFDKIPLVQNPTRAAVEGSKTERRAGKAPDSSTTPTGASTQLNRNATISLSNSQAVALWRRSLPSLAFLSGHSDADAIETNGSNMKTFGSISPSSSPLQPDLNSFSHFPSLSRKSRSFALKFGNGTGNGGGVHGNGSSTSNRKVPTVQDLAIQPVQRVVRYVLLYKDLFNSTPETSPSRALVERALEGASRIAQRCNRAQDNADFLL